MSKLSLLATAFIILYSCSNPVRNEDTQVVVELGTSVEEVTDKKSIDAEMKKSSTDFIRKKPAPVDENRSKETLFHHHCH